MKLKILLAAVAAMGLAACSPESTSISTGYRDILVSQKNPAGAKVLVDDKGKQSVADEVSATYTFRSTPGSIGGRIIGYKVTADTVDGIDYVNAPVGTTIEPITGVNTYVTSGFVCEPAPKANQSCDKLAAATKPGDGYESAEIKIAFQAALINTVKAALQGKTRVTTIVFIGKDETGRSFELLPLTTSTTVNFIQ